MADPVRIDNREGGVRNHDVCGREGHSADSSLELDGRQNENYCDTEEPQ